jgi:hypothetical protein
MHGEARDGPETGRIAVQGLHFALGGVSNANASHKTASPTIH